MTQAISTALGSAPIPWAMETQIGAIRAVVAVLDMKLVMMQHSMNTTKVNSTGDGSAPSAPITLSAIISPAPVFSNAVANDKVPPNRKIVFRSIDFSASLSDITPVMINSTAPTQPVTQSFTPISSSKIIPISVAIRITSDNTFFHLGTASKFRDSSKMESPVSTVSCCGRSLNPMVA